MFIEIECAFIESATTEDFQVNITSFFAKLCTIPVVK